MKTEVKANKIESPDPPEYKYVLRFQLSFIEAKKTKLKKSKIFLSFFFSSEANSRTIRPTWTEKAPKCFSLLRSAEVVSKCQVMNITI